MKKILLAIVVIAVVALPLMTTRCESNKQMQNGDVIDSALLLMEHDSVTPRDSSSVKVEVSATPYSFRVKHAKDICDAYWNVMSREQEEAEEYFLFDITRDGIPELWLKVGTCEADYEMLVYSWRAGTGVRRIYTTSAGHSAFFRGKDYVLRQIAHMSAEWWTTFSYRGKIIERDVYEADLLNEEIDEYKEPEEEPFEMLPATDKARLRACFGL